MKLATAILTALIGSATAFTGPAFTTVSRTALKLADEAVEAPAAAVSSCISKEAILAEPNTIEFGQVWDPLNLADSGSDMTLAWYRHSEIKHGRVAMAAFVGWWAVAAGLRLPGELSYGLDFAAVPSKGLEAWDAIPGWGKAQMLGLAFLIEFHDELFHSRRGTHYLKGGTPGKNMVPGLYDPLNFASKDEATLARGRSAEIKNGRLAMIGIAGLYCAANIQGSVPLQPPC